jgi:hypothetical protein
LSNLDLGASLYIKATPYVKINNDFGTKIIYDSFIEERTVVLSSIGTYLDFNIGTDV